MNNNVKLNNGDKEIIVEVDTNTYNSLIKDPEIFFEQILINSSDIDKFESESTAKSSEQKDIKDFKWTENIIHLLLDLRLKKEQDFDKPSCKKLKLWRQVASELNKIASLSVTGEMCDLKYRNLLKTYRVNKKHQVSTGESAVKWEYFEIFDRVIGTKASRNPKVHITGDSFEETETGQCFQSIEAVPETESTGSFPKVNSPVYGKRKAEMSFECYLWNKCKRDDEIRKEKKLKEEKRLEIDKQRWEEKKQLKEKEIEAILILAKEVNSPTYRKRNEDMSLQCYLCNKCKHNEEIRKEEKLKAEERLEIEEQRWEEKKQLKEKEIEAILTLAKAISNK